MTVVEVDWGMGRVCAFVIVEYRTPPVGKVNVPAFMHSRPAPSNLVGDMTVRRQVVSSSSSLLLQLHPPPPSAITDTNIVSAAAPKNTMIVSAIKAWSVQEKNGLQDFIKVCSFYC
jgi:histone deacetylase complex regulatory component SIN3